MKALERPPWLIDLAALGLALTLATLVCLGLFRGARAAAYPAEQIPSGTGLYLVEQLPGGGGPYRWTASQARIELPNPGGPLVLGLRLAAGAGRDVDIRLDGPVATTIPLGSELRRYKLLAPPHPGESLTVRLSAPPFRPPGEPRELGVQLAGVAIGGGGVAPATTILALLLATAALYGALRVVLGHALAGPGALTPMVALLVYDAVRWEEARFAPLAALIAMVGLFAVLGWYLTLAAARRWRAAAPGALRHTALPALAALAYLAPAIWNQLYVHPRLDLDLGIYLEAARALRAGGSPYDTLGLGTIVIGESFVYPPASLPLFMALLALGDYGARAFWLTGSLALYLFALLSIYAALPGAVSRGALAAILVLGFGYAPFLETLAIGQINVLILLGMALFIHGHVDRRLAWAGDLALAVAILIKLTPGILLLWPLARRDGARLARVCLGLALIALPSLLLYGPGPWREFVGLLPDLLQGAPRNPYNQAIVGALTGLTVPGSPVETVALWLGRAASLLLLGSFGAICWLRRRAANAAVLAYGVAVLTASSSLIWYHHLTFLVIPLAWLGVHQASAAPTRPGDTVAALAALALVQLTRPAEMLLGIPPWTAAAGYLIVVVALAGRLLHARKPWLRHSTDREGAGA